MGVYIMDNEDLKLKKENENIDSGEEESIKNLNKENEKQEELFHGSKYYDSWGHSIKDVDKEINRLKNFKKKIAKERKFQPPLTARHEGKLITVTQYQVKNRKTSNVIPEEYDEVQVQMARINKNFKNENE
jgi:hypothetical protein